MDDSDFQAYPIHAQLPADNSEDHNGSILASEIPDNSILEFGVSPASTGAPLAEGSQDIISPHCLTHVVQTQVESSSTPNSGLT